MNDFGLIQGGLRCRTDRTTLSAPALLAVLDAQDACVMVTGLTYLRQLPVQSVKIDQSFVVGIPSDEGSRTLVSASIALTHELKLHVIAAGVETEGQLSFLSNHSAIRCRALSSVDRKRRRGSKMISNQTSEVATTSLSLILLDPSIRIFRLLVGD